MKVDIGRAITDWWPDWIEVEGFYKAKVHFGDTDYAVVCPVSCGSVEQGLDAVMSLYEVLLGAGQRATEADVLAAVQAFLTSEKREGLRRDIIDIVGASLVEWHMPEMASLPAFGEKEPSIKDFPAVFEKLPLSVVARLLAGISWQAKNSCGGSTPPAPA